MIYDSKTGGCCDGLHIDRVNSNQGAESTLAFLIALAEMTQIENDLKSFQTSRERELPSQEEAIATNGYAGD